MATNTVTAVFRNRFDASAAYIGAFKDADDDWATKGKWAVWSEK